MPIRTCSSALLLSLASATLGFAQEDRGLLRDQLARAGREAFAASSPSERNQIHALAVARESSALTAKALRVTSVRDRANLRRVFHSAALEAGEAFVSGSENARFLGGPIAYHHLPAVLAAVDGRALPSEHDVRVARSTVRKAAAEDVARVVAESLGVKVEGGRFDKVVGRIPKVAPDDFFHGEVEKMVRKPSPEDRLKPQEVTALKAGLRMANATWKSAQVHRAIEEKSAKRVTIGGNYNPFDSMVRETYEKALEEQRKNVTREFSGRGQKPSKSLEGAMERIAQRRALARVVYEVYKDLHEIRRGLVEDSPAVRDAKQAETQKRLGRAYARDLLGKPFPDLIREALNERFDPRSGGRRLSRNMVLEMLTGLSQTQIETLDRERNRALNSRGAAGSVAELLRGNRPRWRSR